MGAILCVLRASQDWGEQLDGVKTPKLYVASFKSNSILPVAGTPEGLDEKAFCAGMPVFSPDGSRIVYIAWPTEPFRLGPCLTLHKLAVMLPVLWSSRAAAHCHRPCVLHEPPLWHLLRPRAHCTRTRTRFHSQQW